MPQEPEDSRPLTCGEYGGRTKTGEPCTIRVKAGLCHHHIKGTLRPGNDPADAPLHVKEQIFVDEYLKDLHPGKAALRAGYSQNTASTDAYCWAADGRAKPHVYKAIQKAMQARSRRTQVMADQVLMELSKIGFADMRDFMRWDEDRGTFVPSKDLPSHMTSAISSVRSVKTTRILDDGTELERHDLELKLHSKIQALKEIGRHLGIADKLEVSGSIRHEVQKLSDVELAERIQQQNNRLAALGLPGFPGSN